MSPDREKRAMDLLYPQPGERSYSLVQAARILGVDIPAVKQLVARAINRQAKKRVVC